jgi:hypothetical protein
MGLRMLIPERTWDDTIKRNLENPNLDETISHHVTVL